MLLAIDTSTGFAGIALTENGEVLSELAWQCRANHSVELLPRLATLLKLAQRTPGQLEAIVVARGPGSFNGLRVGVSTAKGLAFSLNLPLVGISTLAAAAWGQAAAGLPVCALLPAGREELAAAIYQKQGAAFLVLVSEHLTTVSGLVGTICEPTIFCGEYPSAVAPELQEKLGNNARFASAAASLRRAANLGELGAVELKAGRVSDAATLQPIYLRRPPITERKTPVL
jgi:tRNA threonylcarbamoyl adenosine modification protein YeaZ